MPLDNNSPGLSPEDPAMRFIPEKVRQIYWAVVKSSELVRLLQPNVFVGLTDTEKLDLVDERPVLTRHITRAGLLREAVDLVETDGQTKFLQHAFHIGEYYETVRELTLQNALGYLQEYYATLLDSDVDYRVAEQVTRPVMRPDASWNHLTFASLGFMGLPVGFTSARDDEESLLAFMLQDSDMKAHYCDSNANPLKPGSIKFFVSGSTRKSALQRYKVDVDVMGMPALSGDISYTEEDLVLRDFGVQWKFFEILHKMGFYGTMMQEDLVEYAEERTRLLYKVLPRVEQFQRIVSGDERASVCMLARAAGAIQDSGLDFIDDDLDRILWLYARDHSDLHAFYMRIVVPTAPESWFETTAKHPSQTMFDNGVQYQDTKFIEPPTRIFSSEDLADLRKLSPIASYRPMSPIVPAREVLVKRFQASDHKWEERFKIYSEGLETVRTRAFDPNARELEPDAQFLPKIPLPVDVPYPPSYDNNNREMVDAYTAVLTRLYVSGEILGTNELAVRALRLMAEALDRQDETSFYRLRQKLVGWVNDGVLEISASNCALRYEQIEHLRQRRHYLFDLEYVPTDIGRVEALLQFPKTKRRITSIRSNSAGTLVGYDEEE